MSGLAYEYPQRIRTEGAAGREYSKLRRGLARAALSRDVKSVAYLTGRLTRLRAARIERGMW